MSNLGQYIADVRLYVGDLSSTEYSDSIILQSLTNAIQYLQPRWFNKYMLYSSGIRTSPQIAPAGYVSVNVPEGTCNLADTVIEGDVFRNCHYAFTSASPPIIEQRDLPAILIAASYLLRRAKAASSMTGLSWSTPDLSFSNIQSSKLLLDLMKQDLAALEYFFRLKLGSVQVGRFSRQYEFLDNYNPVDAANWYNRLAQEKVFSKG